MASDPDSEDSAARLEAALERIALLAHPLAAPGPEAPERAALAERLDRIIARLHRALEDDA